MPKELEDKLRKQDNKHRDWSAERKRAYVFGTMHRLGWRRGKKKDVGAVAKMEKHGMK